VAIHPGDARDIFDSCCPRRRIDRAFLLYPILWPKTRHHLGRFVTPEHLEPLVKGAQSPVRFSVSRTDIEDYGAPRRLNRCRANGFEWLAERRRRLGKSRGAIGISTRYEQKSDCARGGVPHLLNLPQRLSAGGCPRRGNGTARDRWFKTDFQKFF